eukprot:scaffold1687_cov405-Prasinococcus_capsulatus_cf.AAC.27
MKVIGLGFPRDVCKFVAEMRTLCPNLAKAPFRRTPPQPPSVWPACSIPSQSCWAQIFSVFWLQAHVKDDDPCIPQSLQNGHPGTQGFQLLSCGLFESRHSSDKA